MTESPTLEALKQEAETVRIQAEAGGGKVFVLVAAIKPGEGEARHVEFANSVSAGSGALDGMAWLQMLEAERQRVMAQLGLRP